MPTPTGSTTILVAVVDGKVTKEEINAAMKAAQTESYGYTEEELVSSDFFLWWAQKNSIRERYPSR